MHDRDEYLLRLTDPASDGVVQLKEFIGSSLLVPAQAELHDQDCVPWRNNHIQQLNADGTLIITNDDEYALKLSLGDQSPLERMPALVEIAKTTQRFVRELGRLIPVLVKWEPNELALMRYDDPDLGLSFHRDNERYLGVIAIVALEGICDFVTRQKKGAPETIYQANAGDLFLVRANDLVNRNGDYRHQHAVMNIRPPSRTSMTLRYNRYPDKPINGYTFDNWPSE